jgi:anti-anti-sigma regulatory factor
MDIKTFVETGQVPVTVMHVDGNIDSSTYEAFQAKADELIKNGAHYILVDLTHAPYVSSAGMRALQRIYDQLRALHPDSDVSAEDVKKGIGAGTYKSPHLKLLNPSKEAANTFEMTGFDMYIEIFTDKAQAIASF